MLNGMNVCVISTFCLERFGKKGYLFDIVLPFDAALKILDSVPTCSSSTTWATWLEEKCSHCRTLRMVFWEGTEKASHSSWDPSPKRTRGYKYSDILFNHSLNTSPTHQCQVLHEIVIFHFPLRPLGGTSRCWASHSFCLELWRQGLPTN